MVIPILIIPIGISGSGKSTLYKREYSDFYKVSPDDIRRELYGSVNEQKDPKKVFEIAYKRVEKALSQRKEVFFDATNLSLKGIKKLLSIAEKEDVLVDIRILKDSNSPELCKRRVRNDIEIGADRSDVPEEVIDRQYQKFNSLMDNNEFWRLETDEFQITDA